jgi:hypothetical protein
MEGEVIMPQSNKEKSEKREAILNALTESVADNIPGFREFLNAQPFEQKDPTWRRLGTFLKRQYENGAVIKIVIESGASGQS